MRTDMIKLLRETAEYSRERFDADGLMVAMQVEPFLDGMTARATNGTHTVEKAVTFAEIEAGAANMMLLAMRKAADELAKIIKQQAK